MADTSKMNLVGREYSGTGSLDIGTAEYNDLFFDPASQRYYYQVGETLKKLSDDNLKALLSPENANFGLVEGYKIGSDGGIQPALEQDAVPQFDDPSGIAIQQIGAPPKTETFEQLEAQYKLKYDPETKAAVEAARTKELGRAQKKDVALKLGLPALIGAIDLYQQTKPTELDTYAEEEIAKLKKQRETGQMGLSGEEKGLLMQAQMAPVRGMAREERMRREAGEAATGVQTSAAGQERARRASTEAVTQAAKTAGLTMAQADLARADQNLRRMESMMAYQTQRQKEKQKTLSTALGQLGLIAGDIAAKGAVSAPNLTETLTQGAANQGETLTTEQLNRLSRKFGVAFVSEERARKILQDEGLEPTDELISQLTRSA